MLKAHGKLLPGLTVELFRLSSKRKRDKVKCDKKRGYKSEAEASRKNYEAVIHNYYTCNFYPCGLPKLSFLLRDKSTPQFTITPIAAFSRKHEPATRLKTVKAIFTVDLLN